MKWTIGVVVNPIAGMGGKVGLKGTDGPEALRRATAAGATPQAPQRAAETLAAFEPARDELHFLTCPGTMGEASFRGLDLDVEVICAPGPEMTTAVDTERAVAELHARCVDLLLFVGGDGTARDVCRSAGDALVVLGVPAGVKMQSAAFATSPVAAARLALRFLREEGITTREAEVMDIDEEDYRLGRLSARLYGYVTVPFEQRLVQGVKAGSPASEEMEVAEIARSIVEEMDDELVYVLGPGTTMRAIATALNLPKTLLGVDVVRAKQMVALDVSERELLNLTRHQRTRIIVTVIGGQGYVFGRGNQQISADVIKQVGVSNIIVVATERKIVALRGRPLLVDTGDDVLNQSLDGYIKIRTGPRRATVYRVTS